ncbi:hypothetical protein SVIOM342S_05228 [Streptomyces violaceorubidus]
MAPEPAAGISLQEQNFQIPNLLSGPDSGPLTEEVAMLEDLLAAAAAAGAAGSGVCCGGRAG